MRVNFIFPETAEGTFYNLVVGKDSLGILKTPYVLRYTSNPTSYQAFADSGFNMDYFNGIISMHKYTDYFELDEFSKTSDPYCPPDYDENGDPIPCEESNVNGGGTGSGGTGTGNGGSNNSGGSSGPYNGSGGGYGGSSSSCPFSILVHREERPCSACPSSTGWFTVVTYLYDCGGVKSAGASKTSDDCPECNVNDGGVGVNVPRLVTLLISQLNITDQDVIDWMEDPSNLDQVELVNQWLRENGSTPENEAFVNLALEALEDGGEVDFEELVILDEDFKNNDCLKGVYDTMGSAPTFKNYLENFDDEFSVAHLKFDASTSLSSSTNAETSPPNNYLITITFNENNLDRPSLSIARTLIHEMIHAEIFRKLLSAAQQPNLNFSGYTDEEWRNFIISLREDYEGLYDYYLRWRWAVPAGETPSSAQHEAMAQHYRDIIEDTLREYDNTQTDAVYEALAWTGLMGSGTFDSTTGLYSNSTVAWSNLNQQERLNILNTINTFNTSNPNCQD